MDWSRYNCHDDGTYKNKYEMYLEAIGVYVSTIPVLIFEDSINGVLAKLT